MNIEHTKDETEIHGENATSIAAMLEHLQYPNGPLYEEALAKAQKFVEAEHAVRFEISRQRMQEERDAQTDPSYIGETPDR